MQAPLSSTASGQHLRTGPPLGLPSSPLSPYPLLERPTLPAKRERRLPDAAEPASSTSVAEGRGLAHDAGNLLGALRLYCDLMAMPGVLREEHRHYARELQLLSQRSAVLIDRLLNPATTRRKQGGQEQVIVPEVVEQCRGLLSRIAQRAVEVTYGAGATVPVTVPREAVERILVNLTKNAAQASAGSGAIRLRVCRVEDGVGGAGKAKASPTRIALSIEDQGCGMSTAAVKVLLGQAPAERQSSQAGHGLGLRIVRELVQNSGGELRLKSQSGCGTTIEIAWAVADAALPADTPALREGRKSHAAWHINQANEIEGSVSC